MTQYLDSNALQERRNKITHDMRKIVETAAQEDRALTNDERQQFDRMDADQEQLRARIDDIRKVEGATLVLETNREVSARAEFAVNPKSNPDRITQRDRDLAFRGWLMGGQSDHEIPADYVAAAQKCGLNLNRRKLVMRLGSRAPRTFEEARQIVEARATSDAQSTTAAAGGNTIANETMAALEVTLLAFGGIRQACRVVRTATGATLPVPTADDTAASGARLAENTSSTTHSVPFGQVTFSAHKYTSHLVPASIEFIQDSSINVAQFLGEALGTRIGRIQNSEFTTNSSTVGGPEGIVGPSTTKASALGSTASTFSLVYTDVVTLLHSVDPAYRVNPGAGFMFNDNTLSAFKKLVDSQGRPLWLPSVTQGGGDMILGYPFTINQSMVSFATTTNAKVMVFGDLQKFWVREAMDVEIIRLDERYAELGQVAWVGFARADSGSIQYSAIKHMRTPST